MTKKEFMEKVIAMIEKTEIVDEEVMVEFAHNEIEKIDRANERKKSKMTEKAKENIQLMDKIYEDILKVDEPTTATTVGEYMEISTQKASSLLRKMVDEGRATVEDVKIPKKGIQKGYKRKEAN